MPVSRTKAGMLTPTRTSGTTADNSAGTIRALPHALEAERAVLGCMLLEPVAIGEVLSVLGETGAESFFFPNHAQLYRLVLQMWDENKVLDGVIIKDELVRRGVFDALGGYEFLTGLVGAVPSALRAREYAQIVREKHLLRRLVDASHRVMDSAYGDGRSAQEVMDYAEQTIFEVTEKRVTGAAQALPELIDEVFARIQDLDGQVLTGEPTGYLELDELTCGLQPSELIIVAGRPSMGKTALGLNMAEHMALTEGRPVLFFSLEMSRQQVAQRILCSRAQVDAQKLRRGRHSSHDMERLQHVADEIRSRPLYVDDTSSLTVLELRARARMAYRRYGIRAIFVDYLQLMHAPGSESRQVEVAGISRGLKALAKELRVPVIAMAQLNRNPEDRTNNRPRMSDLRESGAIEQDADVIMLLHRESYYKSDADGFEPDDSAELIVAKQRNGPVGTIKLHFNKPFTRFDNPHSSPERFENTYEAHRAPPPIAEPDFGE